MASLSGVPYDEVRWQPIDGQPFGNGVGYNGIIFGKLANIVDMEGPVAVEGDVTSYRGMSVSFGRGGELTIPYDAKAVRFLAGGNVAINGALTVVGNVLTAGGSFNVGTGSTYLIGKSGESNQRELLSQLYAANGSPYWEPADHHNYYIISSYDAPRRIPASRVGANVPAFFADARQYIQCWQNAIASMPANGVTSPTDYGYGFRGTDQSQNVFDLTWPEEGSIVGNLTLDVPGSSVNIVRIHSGDTMTISTPLWGTEAMATRTLYVLMNARTVNLPFPTAIYGSVYAPQAVWNALTTGGNINGNAALGGLRVQEGSGFELHWYPFAGGIKGVSCGGTSAEGPVCPSCPAPTPCAECPACPTCPAPTPCAECPACPTCPAPTPCAECPACPAPTPCAECPACPAPTPCAECPACPAPTPCAECPACPTCPAPTPCAECPACPAPVPCPDCPACPPCPEPSVACGVIAGCLIPNGQSSWRIKLCELQTKCVLSVWQGCGMGCFSFEVNADANYLLLVESCCHYELRLSNVGVRSLSLRS